MEIKLTVSLDTKTHKLVTELTKAINSGAAPAAAVATVAAPAAQVLATVPTVSPPLATVPGAVAAATLPPPAAVPVPAYVPPPAAVPAYVPPPAAVPAAVPPPAAAQGVTVVQAKSAANALLTQFGIEQGVAVLDQVMAQAYTASGVARVEGAGVTGLSDLGRERFVEYVAAAMNHARDAAAAGAPA